MYPVSVNLAGRRCLVVGGGPVGLRKVITLLECGAIIDLISPNAVNELEMLAEEGAIFWTRRPFDNSDLGNYMMAFACTDDESTNQTIFELCESSGILVNTVDDPQRCNFYVPATLRRGALTISISTEGNSPLLARKLREEMELKYGPEYADYVELLGEARALVKTVVHKESDRREIFQNMLKVDVLVLLEQGKKEEAKGRIFQCIYSWPD